MITIITKNDCFMFNLKEGRNNEIYFCGQLLRMRDDKVKKKIIVTANRYVNGKTYKKQYVFKPSEVETVIYENRRYYESDGVKVDKLISEVSNGER